MRLPASIAKDDKVQSWFNPMPSNRLPTRFPAPPFFRRYDHLPADGARILGGAGLAANQPGAWPLRSPGNHPAGGPPGKPAGPELVRYPMTAVGKGHFTLTVALTEVGHFEAKGYFLGPDSADPLVAAGGQYRHQRGPGGHLLCQYHLQCLRPSVRPQQEWGMGADDQTLKPWMMPDTRSSRHRGRSGT
jgi:hypothetical protein